MILVKPSAEMLDVSGSALELIEAAGRTCYKSEARITPESAPIFVASLIKRGHESVLEHSNIIVQVDNKLYGGLLDHKPVYLKLTAVCGRYTVSGNIRAWRDFALKSGLAREVLYTIRGVHPLVFDDLPVRLAIYSGRQFSIRELQTGGLRGNYEIAAHTRQSVRFVCDRGVSHEVVRHRKFSFSQKSTRYCDYNSRGLTFVIPLFVAIPPGDHTHLRLPTTTTAVERTWFQAMADAEQNYKYLIQMGWKPEQARSVLPNSLKTEVVMTGNLCDWHHFFTLRVAPAAHPQMREIAIPLLADFKQRFPTIFDDILAEEAEHVHLTK